MRRQTSLLYRWSDPAEFRGRRAHPRFDTMALGFISHFSQRNLSCHSLILAISHFNVFLSTYWIFMTLNVCRDHNEFSNGLWTGVLTEMFPRRYLIGTWHSFLSCPWTSPIFHALAMGQLPIPVSQFHTMEVSRIILDFSAVCMKKIFCSFHNF